MVSKKTSALLIGILPAVMVVASLTHNHSFLKTVASGEIYTRNLILNDTNTPTISEGNAILNTRAHNADITIIYNNVKDTISDGAHIDLYENGYFYKTAASNELTSVNATFVGSLAIYTGGSLDDLTFKYNLISVGEPSSDYMIYNTEERIGQLNGIFSNTDNLLELIYDKYSTEEGQETLGLVDKVIKINNLSITFLSNPQSYGDTYALYGWGLNINGNNFYVNSNNPTFVPGVDFYPGEKMYFNPAMWGDKTFEAEINFTYTIEQQVYKEKVVKSQTYTKGVGQISGNYKPDSSVYDDIYYKYLLIWGNRFRKIDTLYTVKIEADTGAVFLIKDRADTGEGDIIVINDTNTLVLDNISNIENIIYKGRMVNGTIAPLNSDVLIDYYYHLAEGVYKEG